MDERRVQEIVERWRLVTPHIRPDAARVELYRSALGGASEALVLGATPELIDLLLGEGLSRVSAIDLHPETMEAMRRLAQRDWSPAELVIGDWRHARPAWRGAFDRVLCDGGLMFLPFPEGWRTVLAAVRDYLRPGGRLIASLTALAATTEDFRDHYLRALGPFEAEWSALDHEQRARRFGELASRVAGLVRLGAVDSEGRVQLHVAESARRWMADDLRRRYPALAHLVGLMFERPFLGDDGSVMVAMPGLERVTTEMTGSGFSVEVLASRRSPPRHFFTVAATRAR